jgi:hypothetical protein
VATQQMAAAPALTAPPLWKQMTWWVLILPIVLFVALAINSNYLLNYTHVLAGALWTGADLFLGFIIGPVMRQLSPEHRRAVVRYLVPKTLLYMPVVSFTTGTAGWFLANRFGFLIEGHPNRPWIFVALTIVTILTIQGLGILLPNNIRIYRELQKAQPNLSRIFRLNRINIVTSGIQGVMQVAIILVMARLVVY